MSRTSRRDADLAPSLFPFLAVLLCTMGALVLILMLMVSGAQSAVQQVAAEMEEQLEWEESKIQLVSHSLKKKLDQGLIELEKKRLNLQNLEQHINELTEELQQLAQQAELAEKTQNTQVEAVQQRKKQISDLEKQLADAKKELQQKLDDPKGDKPIFAIIPYDGPNGTHRRPIYLECNGKGLVIQPEGIVLSPNDLKPPYGPGNPLDAALRTIRAEFPTTNGSVTSNPYPLLVVRPSGIRHYMLARAAMSGWDDQFGYELISEDLELSFPPSLPQLKDKTIQAIQLARQRQAALILAMPQVYDASQLDFAGSSSSSGQLGEPPDENSLNWPADNLSAAGSDRSGYSMPGGVPKTAQGAGAGPAGVAAFGPQTTSNANGLSTEGAAGSSDRLSSSASSLTGMRDAPTGDRLDPKTVGGAGESFFGSNRSHSSAGVAGDQSGAGSTSEFTRNSLESSGTAGDLSEENRSGTQTGSAGGQAGSSGGTANSSANSSANPNSSAGQTATSARDTQCENCDPSGMDASNQGGSPSLNINVSRSPPEDSRPIAKSRGANWAWRGPNRTQTAVVRSIRLQCYLDRWVLVPENGSAETPVIIELNDTPAQRASKLSAAVNQRVDTWGVALAGGHWTPILHVDVADNAQWRFDQLKRLLEGSGIEVVRRNTISSGNR